MKGASLVTRLGFAWRGITRAFVRERSLRAQGAAALAVIAALLATSPSPVWWALAALAVGLVLTAELMNSAIETLADHLHPEHHPAIGLAKDIAAGAVLVASVTALLIALAFLLR